MKAASLKSLCSIGNMTDKSRRLNACAAWPLRSACRWIP